MLEIQIQRDVTRHPTGIDFVAGYDDSYIETIKEDLSSGNDRDITGTLGPNAGIKVFLTDQTYLGFRYRYEWFFNSLKQADNNADHGNHVATIGIGFVWGGARKTTN